MANYTFYVTVSGGKFVIDGVSQQTVDLGHDLTYRFDQSDSSNGAGGTHPLRFSTTSDGTHGGGSALGSGDGVTTNGTPGQSGAYTEIAVTSSTTNPLYYYCSNHSGMGGQANTTSAEFANTTGVALKKPILANATDKWGQFSNQNLDIIAGKLPQNFTFPTDAGTNNYVLTRDDSVGTGGTAWKQTTKTPTITSITYPTESGIASTALQASGGSDNNIKTLTITNGGTGYSGSGTLSATGGGGNGFAGTYTVSGGVIDSVTITDAGQEYTSAPTIVVSGSTSGTSAVITASILETLLINGSNFTSTVTVNISGNSVSSSAFAGTVSVNGTGTVITCSNVTKRASADNYTLTVTNSTGLNTTTTVNFSADPSFSTASDLGTVYTTGSAMSAIRVNAGSSVTWTNGATNKPTWMTVTGETSTADNGLSDTTYEAVGSYIDLGGTPTNTTTSEVQNFNIIIRDAENQSHNRDFSLTVADLPTGDNGNATVSIGGTNYYVMKFTSNGTLTLYGDVTVDYLLVGGGGSGGLGSGSGGGGSGMLLTGTNLTLSAGAYDIAIGIGGRHTDSTYYHGEPGGVTKITRNSDSTVMALAIGGGTGGGENGTSPLHNGRDGGSGGGGFGHNTITGNAGSPVASFSSYTGYVGSTSTTFPAQTAVIPSGGLYYGNDGGAGGQSYFGGGGGGAGADGQVGYHSTSSPSTVGAGGNGLATIMGLNQTDSQTILGATNITAGVVDNGVRYLAGGGGGHKQNSSTPAPGGLGGGGAGGAYNAGSHVTYGVNGTANTGGGGGGGLAPGSADGGSGIIILRFAI